MYLSPLRAARNKYLDVCVVSNKFGGRSADQRNYCVSFCLPGTFFTGPSFCFFPSNLLSSTFYALPPVLIVVTQIRGHIASSPPPLPTTVRVLHFLRDFFCELANRVFILLQVSFCPVKGGVQAGSSPNESDYSRRGTLISFRLLESHSCEHFRLAIFSIVSSEKLTVDQNGGSV